MRIRSVLRNFVAFVLLLFTHVSTTAFAAGAGWIRMPAAEDPTSYFVFEARGNCVRAGDAQDCINRWSQQDLQPLHLTLKLLRNGSELSPEATLATGDLARFEQNGVPAVTDFSARKPRCLQRG